ncbi:MAG: LysR family transcriptional regulator [Clostridia bacterium]|nr:LysR family transcriptional regulator [Clostridia bacterium]
METFKIEAILAAVEYKSLSRAAEEFSYTPSAFSHMLSSFEKELGVRLFKRSSTGVILTEEGRNLYPILKKMRQCEKELWQAVATLNGTEDYTLRVGAYSSISRHFLSDFTRKLKKHYPYVKLSVQIVDNLEGWIKNDKADLVFADDHSLEGTDWIPMAIDRFFAVSPPDLLKNRDFVTREELYEYPHIYTDDHHVRHYFDTESFKEFIYFKSEDDLSLLNMVKDGLGVSVVPELVLKETLQGINVIPLEPELTRQIGFTYNKERIRQLGLTQFIKSLKMEKKA